VGWWQSATVGRGCVHNPRASLPVSCFSCCRSCLVLCARSRASRPAGFSACTTGRPSWSAGPWSIVHEPGRPTSAVVLALCCVMACPAVHEPAGARARVTGSVVRSRTQPAPAGPYGPARRLWPYHGRRNYTGMLAPAMRPRPHRVAYRERAQAAAGPAGPASRRVHHVNV